MAEACVMVDYFPVDLYKCPICLDLLKDPVTLPCGRSFCKVCINEFWDQDHQSGVYRCPDCRDSFTQRPVLHRNNMLAEKVEKLKKTEVRSASPAHCYAGPGDVECDFCTGRKHKAVKSCLMCLASFCETHLKPHYEIPSWKNHKLVDATKNLKEKICSEHDKLLEIYCRTDQRFICYLCMMDKHKSHETVLAASQRAEKQSELKEEQMKSQQRIQEPTCREEFLHYFHHLTLDPNTAHRYLILTDKNRAATDSRVHQPYADHPERFDLYAQVLSKESVCGRAYWEVEWSSEKSVYIAVSYKTIRRKGKGTECWFGGNNQSWGLSCSSSLLSFRHNDNKNELGAPSSSRIGVYVDHSAGTLSFYSVSDTMKLLHRVHTTFTQPLYAGFWLRCYGSTVRLCDPRRM